jgi:hypothetical protein
MRPPLSDRVGVPYASGVPLAELEVRHSRPIAPTRRVALGELYLPVEPAPGFGGILLAGIVGAFVSELDEDLVDPLAVLMDALEHGRRVSQPRLRYRFQTDIHGLDRSRHKLLGSGEACNLELDDHSTGLPQILAAVYAAGLLPVRARPAVFRLLRRATRWHGGADDRLVAYLTGEGPRLAGGTFEDEGWALAVLGFTPHDEPARSDIQRRFRRLLRQAHPDHGGESERAAQRISDLTEAKRILVADVERR